MEVLGTILLESVAREEAASDGDLFTFEYESLCGCLTEVMQRKTKGNTWKASVKGFGWMKRDGYKYFRAVNGLDMLRAILPLTDCTFHVYNYGRGLAVQNFHHDAPTGEWYYIMPVAYSTFEKNV